MSDSKSPPLVSESISVFSLNWFVKPGWLFKQLYCIICFLSSSPPLSWHYCFHLFHKFSLLFSPTQTAIHVSTAEWFAGWCSILSTRFHLNLWEQFYPLLSLRWHTAHFEPENNKMNQTQTWATRFCNAFIGLFQNYLNGGKVDMNCTL